MFFKDYNLREVISDLPLSRKSDHKKEKSVVSFMHEQNIICSETKLDDIEHEQTIICRQLFVGHVVGCWPMKRQKNMQQMIILLDGHLGCLPFSQTKFCA